MCVFVSVCLIELFCGTIGGQFSDFPDCEKESSGIGESSNYECEVSSVIR